MIHDDFEHDRTPGTVVGSAAADGSLRGGVDAEGSLAVDNGALRIGFLEQPGWGREGIAYGPLPVKPGLAMSALVLNGHNASELHDPPVYGLFAGRWHRLKRALLPSRRPPVLPENLAVGWSEGPGNRSERPRGPLFFVHQEHDGQNATLCGRVGDELAPLLPRLRDLPYLYLVVLRPEGAVYYAAAGIEGTPGLPALPSMRPLAVDPTPPPAELLASVEQSVIAESGWRIDSRVQAVRVDGVPELAAVAPDPGPAGLVCGRLDALGSGLRWRGGEAGDGFALTLDADAVTLSATVDGDATDLARERGAGPGVFAQVRDDGEELAVLLDGVPAFGGALLDRRLGDRAGAVALGAVNGFEAFPRELPVPEGLLAPAPWDKRGTELLFCDRFEGPAGELGDPWIKREGKGRVLLEGGGGARIDASRESPNPGRLIYTRPWERPEFAEIAVDHTPAGVAEGEGEGGRIGLVFMQDPGNYLIVNVWVDDAYPGTSISSFLMLDGEEDHYRAVWCNIGRTVRWGVRSRLAIAFDGMRWTARVDGVPVLHRSIRDVYPRTPRLRLTEVGFTANWEWGDDTGSLLHEFNGWGRDR